MNGSGAEAESFSDIWGFRTTEAAPCEALTVLDGLDVADHFLVFADVTSVGGHVGSVKNVLFGHF